MLLVTLVVVGHSWVLLPNNAVTDHVYDFLYAWHVPAFVFVTGYLSRSFVYSRVRLWQLFRLLRRWYGDNKCGKVTTADFVALAERVAGTQLDAFFDAWLHQEGRPAACDA